MEDRWPSGIVLWGTVPNRHMLRWLTTVVVSDVEKAHVMRQVGTMEPTAVRRRGGGNMVCGFRGERGKAGADTAPAEVWPGERERPNGRNREG
jgi:hypothetical protein